MKKGPLAFKVRLPSGRSLQYFLYQPALLTVLVLTLGFMPAQVLAQLSPDTSLSQNNQQQLPDTLPQPDSGSVDMVYTLGPLFRAHTDSFRRRDTVLGSIQQYQRIYQLGAFAEDLGNIGTPVYSLQPLWSGRLGFRAGLDYAAYYRRPLSQVRYYDVPRPLSVIDYVQGDEEMQLLNIRHTQNFHPLWNASLDYDRIVSQGFYFNQETGLSDVTLSTNAASHDHHYRLFAHAYFHTVKNRENGGMESDSAFRAEAGSNRTRLPVRLEEAFAVSRYRRYYADQYYLLGKFKADTVPDSVMRSRQLNQTQARSYLRWENRYERWEYRFEEDQRNEDDFGGGFYERDRTRDLTRAQHFMSRLATRWAPRWGRRSGARITAAAAQHLARYGGTYLSDRYFQYTAGEGRLALELGSWNLQGEVATILQGDFLGDYRAQLATQWKSGDSLLSITMEARNWQQAPKRKAERYVGNYIFNIQNLGPENHTDFTGSLSIPAIHSRLSANLHRVDNLTYFDATDRFAQLDRDIGYFGARIRQDLAVGGWHLKLHLLGQRWLADNVPVALPDWAARASTYYQFYLFEKALNLRAGLDGRWHSGFFANAYRPFVAEFAPQRSIEVGNYPFIDLWISGQVKDFRFFVKFEHFNQGIFGQNYYTIPRYPIFPRSLRFGITWRLLD